MSMYREGGRSHRGAGVGQDRDRSARWNSVAPAQSFTRFGPQYMGLGWAAAPGPGALPLPFGAVFSRLSPVVKMSL